MLGTIFTSNRDSAGDRLRRPFINGWLFSLLYVAFFSGFGFVSWWLGALMGIAHGAFVLIVVLPLLPGVHPRMASEFWGPTPTRLLEPPGFLALHYGYQTPTVTMMAHFAFGLVLGSFYKIVIADSQCRTDVREVRERLGKVAEKQTIFTDLLGVKTDLIGPAVELLEEGNRFGAPLQKTQRLHPPEGAGDERSFLPRQAVVDAVTIDQIVNGQRFLQRINGSCQPRIFWVHKADQRKDKGGCIKR
ncbi:MAG: hypothetical protein MPW15_22400 [Candidatus Manganitrophus sp.]|nr:hypothetical protein [Candidatus Manganitrophus sp.]